MRLTLATVLALAALIWTADLTAHQADRAEWNAWVRKCRADPAAEGCRAYYGQQEE